MSNITFIADHGQKQFTLEAAKKVCGMCFPPPKSQNFSFVSIIHVVPDFSRRDLYHAIEKGEKLSWTAKIQPNEADPKKLGFDPFDAAKVWPKGRFPHA